MNDATITGLFDHWNQALQTGDPKNVVHLYHREAILIPTLSNRVRRTPEDIEDYFYFFLKRKPVGKIDESTHLHLGNTALRSGLYTFDFEDGTSAQARFSFVYLLRAGEWKIIQHHSSFMPES